MKRTRILQAIAVAAVLPLMLTACGSGSDDTATSPQTGSLYDSNAQPRSALKQGGEAHFAVVDIPEQMNTMHSDGDAYGARIWQWYNPQTILMTPDGKASPNPDYLTDMKTEVKGGKTITTYTINPKAVWNDGTPIDWTAFENTWKALNGTDSKYSVSSTDGYSQIASVKPGKDSKQAVVTYKSTFPWTDGLFWNLLNPHIKTADQFNTAYLKNLHPEWGAGPYTVDKYDAHAGTVSFVPNDKWWGPKPMLDKVTFAQMEDQASLNAFKNGELDEVGVGTKDRLSQVQSMVSSGNAKIYRAVAPSNRIMELNAERPQLKDLRVRQALMMGINRDAVTKLMWNGLDYSEPPVGSLNLYSFQDGYVDALSKAGYKYDPDAANKLLDEAGWTMDSKTGYRAKGGTPLEVSLPIFGDDPLIASQAQLFQAMLKQIGIKVDVVQKPDSAFAKVLSTKDWDIVNLAFTSSDPYGVEWMCQLYCSDSGLNLSNTGTKAIDKEIQDKVASLPTAEEQTKAGMALESEIIKKTWGILPLYNGPVIKAVKPGLANLDPEEYEGLDLFGVSPVENLGWMK